MHAHKTAIDKADQTEIEVLMSKEEAEELTRGIQSTSSALYVLLKRAHDGKAWAAMGYKSWSEYIEGEFDFSRTRSYQLINQANVIEKIHESSGVQLYITEREARSIKKKLPEITEKIKKAISEEDSLSEDETKAKVREIIDESEEVDNAANFKGGEDGWDSPESYESKEDNRSNLEEWKPDNVEKMLTDNERIALNNLITTLKFFETMQDGSKFGARIKESNTDKKEELIRLSDFAFSWLTQLMDEIE